MSLPRSSRLDSVLRRVAPSTSALSYSRLFRYLTNPISRLYQQTSPLFSSLPPNHLRVRVGVGNELLFNHARHLTAGSSFWLGAALEGWFHLDDDIVDLGCGCGRYAQSLRDHDFYGRRYSGTYTGVDIDREMLDWCSENFPARQFRFIASTHASDSYRGTGTGATGIDLDIVDDSQDLVFSRSLFSHLLPTELEDYVSETARILRPGGFASMTFYSLDSPPPTLGNRHTFRHQVGIARVESEMQPTAAVAYHDSDLIAMFEGRGFDVLEVTDYSGVWQQMLLARLR